jgi:hypothetical protein
MVYEGQESDEAKTNRLKRREAKTMDTTRKEACAICGASANSVCFDFRLKLIECSDHKYAFSALPRTEKRMGSLTEPEKAKWRDVARNSKTAEDKVLLFELEPGENGELTGPPVSEFVTSRAG